MPESKRRNQRVWPAVEASALPVYDLLGQERLAHDALNQLNQSRRLLSQMVAGCFSRLFNGLSCQMDYAPFHTRLMSEVASDGQLLWVQATNQHGRQAWLAISAPHLYRLAILFFGGSPLQQDQTINVKAATETEQRLLLRLAQHQLDILSDLLGEPEDRWELNLVGSEALPFSQIWLCSEGTLLLGEHDSQFWIWWPFASKEMLALDGPAPASLGEQMCAALPAVPVRLRVVLSEFTLSLGELQQLQTGDLLPLEMAEPAPALIGHQSCFTGRLAERNGALVYQVASLIHARRETNNDE
ncbi:MAG: FliM/FliN family flagellar motor switch protein [Aeromonadaceae bacterium]